MEVLRIYGVVETLTEDYLDKKDKIQTDSVAYWEALEGNKLKVHLAGFRGDEVG